jgi:hypothetical protein
MRCTDLIDRLLKADKNEIFHEPVDAVALGIPDYHIVGSRVEWMMPAVLSTTLCTLLCLNCASQ